MLHILQRRFPGTVHAKVNFIMNSYFMILSHSWWHYDTVQYDMILQTSLQWLRQKVNQNLHSQKTPHTSPSQVSYGVPIVRILNKNDPMIMAPHWISSIKQLSFCKNWVMLVMNWLHLLGYITIIICQFSLANSSCNSWGQANWY